VGNCGGGGGGGGAAGGARPVSGEGVEVKFLQRCAAAAACNPRLLTPPPCNWRRRFLTSSLILAFCKDAAVCLIGTVC